MRVRGIHTPIKSVKADKESNRPTFLALAASPSAKNNNKEEANNSGGSLDRKHDHKRGNSNLDAPELKLTMTSVSSITPTYGVVDHPIQETDAPRGIFSLRCSGGCAGLQCVIGCSTLGRGLKLFAHFVLVCVE